MQTSRTLPGHDVVAQAAAALQRRNIHTKIVADGTAARAYALSLIPEGARVHQASSQTIEAIGLSKEIEESGRYVAVRPLIRTMDRATQRDEIRVLGAAVDVMLGSVQAVTLTGQVVVASGGGSQVGPYATTAGKVIWVVGTQKIVATLDDAIARIEQVCLPQENVRMQQWIGRDASLNQILVMQGSVQPDRLHLILVNEQLGA